MASSNFQHHRMTRLAGYALALCGVVATSGSQAASAGATATATVVGSAAVVIVVPPTFPGTVVTVESYTQSLSTSGPVLRGPDPPAPSGADGGGAAPGTPTLQGVTGAGMAPTAANVAAVTVTRRADGALAVSGGSTLTFSVSAPGAGGTLTIEYN